MKKSGKIIVSVLMGIAVIVAVCTGFVYLSVVKTHIAIISKSPDEISMPSGFANMDGKISSPSGLYDLYLTAENEEIGNSWKIYVRDRDGNELLSNETFRTRDAFLALWDEKLDRVWAYSGDVGICYWDIADQSLTCHAYMDQKDVKIPGALWEALPDSLK